MACLAGTFFCFPDGTEAVRSGITEAVGIYLFLQPEKSGIEQRMAGSDSHMFDGLGNPIMDLLHGGTLTYQANSLHSMWV